MKKKKDICGFDIGLEIPRQCFAMYLLNIPVRQIRLSGVARATGGVIHSGIIILLYFTCKIQKNEK